MLLFSLQLEPQTVQFAEDPWVPEQIQIWELLTMISKVTNRDVGGFDVACDGAQDYLVLDKSTECPSGSASIKSGQEEDPKLLFGEKCCLQITGFSNTFWNERYSSQTNACRNARLWISEANGFFDALTSKTYGVLPQITYKLYELMYSISNARDALETSV